MFKSNRYSKTARIIFCLLSPISALFVLGFNLVFSTYANQHPSIDPPIPPRWIEFPVSFTGLNVDVYEQYIIWSQHDDQSGVICNPYGAITLPAQTVEFSFAINENRLLNGRPQGLDSDICMMDTRTGEVRYAFNTDTIDYQPRMDGDWIVFIRGRSAGVYTIARNIITGEEIVLTHYPQYNIPNIHNNIVVYTEYAPSANGEAIRAYDLTGGEAYTITTCYSFCSGFPDVFNGTIVWSDSDNDLQDSNILGYDLTSQTYFTISDKPGDELFPRIHNDLVVWQWQTNIYAYDIKSGKRITITEPPATGERPAVSENLIVWVGTVPGSSNEIFGYDLETRGKFQITDNQTIGTFSAVSGNLVAFETYITGIAGARKMTNFSFQPMVAK